MTAPNGKAVAATAALSVAAFAFGNCYAACLLSLPGQPTSNLTAALAAMPAFATGAGILHAGTGPMATGLLAACAVWAAWARALTHGPGERAGEEHGSARWAKPREARRFADANDLRNNVILTRNISMALDQRAAELPERDRRNLNRVVVGGSGSGKTFFDAVPNLLQANCDYFVTDPKGQTLPMVEGALLGAGYEIVRFDTIDFSKSLHYNPIAYVRDEADVLEFVTCLIANTNGEEGQHADDPFWEKAERLLYVALVGYLVRHCPKADRSIAGLVTLLSLAKAREDDEDYMSPLDLLFYEVETGMRYVEAADGGDAAGDPLSRKSGASQRFRWVRVSDPVPVESDFSLLHYKMFKDAAGKTLKSILVSCNTRMEPFAIPQVRELVSRDEMGLDRLGSGDRPRAVFAVTSDTSPLYSFLLAIMVWQAENILCERALMEFGGELPRHVTFLLDEFANIGRLPDVERAIAVVRSRNVSMTIYLQSASQLKARYKESAATIVDCCDTLTFLGGKSTETAKEISESVGKQTVGTVTWNESRGASGSSTRNWNTVERDLIQAAEVARLPRDEAIVLIAGADPIKDKKYDTTRHPRWAAAQASRGERNA
jgi:type IV secretion system protein VirD4